MARSMEMFEHEAAFRGETSVVQRKNRRIIILGAGALGSWLLDLLSRQGYANLTIVDFDKVERKNFGTQNFGRLDVGRLKVQQCSNNLFMRLGIKCQTISEKVTERNVNRLLTGAELVVDLFDNHESRNLVRDACQYLLVPCIHAGMSHDGFAEIEWNERYLARPVLVAKNATNEPCEYPLASNLVHLTVGLLAEAINDFIDCGIKRSIHFTARDLHCDVVVLKGDGKRSRIV